MQYQDILKEIQEELLDFSSLGNVTTTIPELAKIDPNKFGIHLTTIEAKDFGIGDSQERFSIQSISKALTVALAFSYLDEKVWKRVGVEPSGTAFNSLVQLEYEKGIPRNPFINSGAIVIADMLVSCLANPKEDFLQFIRKISGSNTIDYNIAVAQSEKDNGFRNAALANFLKSFGNIDNNVDDVLDFYFHQCSIEMNCQELAHSFFFFANEGETKDGNKILTKSQVKRLNALMQTCGFYDESGEFTYKVGLPGKSGIGGGIVALYPKVFVVATWSPKLNKKGNSELGMHALEVLTTKTGMSVF
ncbi:MAG: glutaminase [Flavobacteriaceae bacterium]|uniref:Glutaminase n=1 Tax=Flavobacterium kayseriense TaxID=2764714 RepID=A0ABR7J2L8_9FLAO|nr:glutaminase [Flavobacterium kayseriense]MBC5839789.1 glutaminase [Flavobacterium kayseriense]MBC5847541.1 glutaminase [Flavobacterium kayseriense]MBX9889557.1 glutaminase [Flavobacteriaceae bacterium]